MIRRFGFSHRVSQAFDVFMIVLAVLGGSQFSIWLFDRDGPVEIKPPSCKDCVMVANREILTPEIYPGDEFKYVNRFVRHKFCETKVQRWLVDANNEVYELPDVDSAMPTTGLEELQEVQVSIDTPYEMAPGPAKNAFRARWICNPIHRWLWPIYGEIEEIPFVVLDPKTRPKGESK